MLSRIVFAIIISSALTACGTTSVGLKSLNTGVLASVDDLRVVLEKTLRDAVDKALDDSASRAVLQL